MSEKIRLVIKQISYAVIWIGIGLGIAHLIISSEIKESSIIQFYSFICVMLGISLFSSTQYSKEDLEQRRKDAQKRYDRLVGLHGEQKVKRTSQIGAAVALCSFLVCGICQYFMPLGWAVTVLLAMLISGTAVHSHYRNPKNKERFRFNGKIFPPLERKQ